MGMHIGYTGHIIIYEEIKAERSMFFMDWRMFYGNFRAF